MPVVVYNSSPEPHTPKVVQRPKVISEPIRGSQVIDLPKPTVPIKTTRCGRVSKQAKRQDLYFAYKAKKKDSCVQVSEVKKLG